MGDKLKSKAIGGARWGFVENFSSLAVTFLVGVILGRILSPDEFGLIGYLTIFIALSISFIDNGFSSAIIKKPNPSSDDLKTVFSTNLIMSMVCYLLLFFLSRPIASLFSIEALAPLLRVLAIVLIINAFSIIQRVLLIKEVDFKKLTVCSLTSSILSGCVGIYLAVKGYGVWSLVWQQISKQLFNTLLLWILGNWKFSIGFSCNSFKELFSYGSKVLISGLLDTLFRYLYYPIVGRFFSTYDLGQYTRSDQFSNVTSNNISQIIQRVGFPIISKVQEDDLRLRNTFRTIILVSALLSSFLCFWLSAISKPLIIGLIGEKWLPATAMLQIIALGGLFVPLHYLNQNILQVKGKMRQYLALEIFKKLLIVLSVIAGIIWGLDVLLWGFVLSNALAYFVFAFYSGRYSGYSAMRQFLDILRPLFISLLCAIICALVTVCVIWICKTHLMWYNVTWTNLLGVLVGTLVALGSISLIYKIVPGKEYSEALNLLKIWKR